MKDKLIAKRYAKAAILNIQENQYYSVIKDIEFLRKAFTQDADYIKSINSFLFPLQNRLKLVKKISAQLNNKVIWENLFVLLVKKHRFAIIMEVLNEMENTVLISNNQVKVSLTIAHEHSETVLNKISSKIADIVKKDVVMKVNIDLEIIGGFIAQTDSFFIDGSIKNGLVKLVSSKK